MPSALEWFYGFCAASLIGYLIGWPFSAFGGARLRRARLFATGGVASAAALFIAGWPAGSVLVLGALGGGIAVGFREAVEGASEVRRRLASIRPSFKPPSLAKAMADAEIPPHDPVPELAPLVRFDERPTTERRHAPPGAAAPTAPAPPAEAPADPVPTPRVPAPTPRAPAPTPRAPAPTPRVPAPTPRAPAPAAPVRAVGSGKTPPPLPGRRVPPPPPRPRIPPKEPTAKGMLGPLTAPDTMHGTGTTGLLGPLDPKNNTQGQVVCKRCGAANSYTASFCVQCNAPL
ncbi:MAG: hypothetical protein AAGF12_34055 [Myxococcota bacterium]